MNSVIGFEYWKNYCYMIWISPKRFKISCTCMIVFIRIWFNYFRKKYWFSPVKGSNFSSYFFTDETSCDVETVWNKNIFPENCCRNWEAEELNSDYYKLQLKINSHCADVVAVVTTSTRMNSLIFPLVPDWKGQIYIKWNMLENL